MNYYIFITNEGNTYRPNTKALEPDCNNSQVLGIASGNDEEEAFEGLKKENTYLSTMSFDEVFCYKLESDNIVNCFNLRDK